MVLPVGRGAFRSARTTWSPSDRPDVTWVKAVPTAPTRTGTLVALPSRRTDTTYRLPIRSTADVGTASASVALAVTMATAAPEPANSFPPSSFRPMVTG